MRAHCCCTHAHCCCTYAPQSYSYLTLYLTLSLKESVDRVGGACSLLLKIDSYGRTFGMGTGEDEDDEAFMRRITFEEPLGPIIKSQPIRGAGNR
jgi:hypothetical protein